jgi:hypothetical protein
MNSDYDITLHDDETASPGMARERFLDSLGLGDVPPALPLADLSTDEVEDEGVVLSSQPDDLELPAADTTPTRAVSISLGSSAERTRTVAISIAAKERQPIAEKTPAMAVAPSPDKPANLDESLSLECPECHGELVLQRRHIGIEGLCVWCHTPIIAAESARDSIVRIFPVLGRISKPFAAASPVVGDAAPVATVPVEAPAAVTENGIDFEAAPSPQATFVTSVPAPAAVETAKEESFTTFAPEAFGFGPLPEISPTVTAASPIEDAPKKEISAFDLDGLYAMSGFGSPAEETTVPSPGFGETISAAAPIEAAAAPAPMNGFGAFLQTGVKEEPAPAAAPATVLWSTPAAAAPSVLPATPQPEAISFSAPTPWGPPLNMPAASAPPVEAAVSREVKDEAPVSLPADFAFSFESTAPEPTPEPVPETSFSTAIWANAFDDSAPAASAANTNEARTDDFAAAFQMSGFGSPAGQSDLGNFSAPGQLTNALEESRPTNDFASAFASAGFAMAETPETAPAPTTPTVDGAETPSFDFHNSPASKTIFGADAREEKRSFAMPGNGFSTGSSSESEATSFSSFVAQPSATSKESSWGISEPLGLSPSDEAPAALSGEMVSGSAMISGANLPFEDNPFADFTPNHVQRETETPISLFQETAPVAVSPALPTHAPVIEQAAPAAASPLRPLSQESTFSSIANPIEAAPNVVSEPLGSRKKPTVRKGFIVLMVVIVGFAAGGALASFVLPVDEYVQSARALMEKKFNPPSVVQQIPALSLPPSDVSEPAASVAP